MRVRHESFRRILTGRISIFFVVLLPRLVVWWTHEHTNTLTPELCIYMSRHSNKTRTIGKQMRFGFNVCVRDFGVAALKISSLRTCAPPGCVLWSVLLIRISCWRCWFFSLGLSACCLRSCWAPYNTHTLTFLRFLFRSDHEMNIPITYTRRR